LPNLFARDDGEMEGNVSKVPGLADVKAARERIRSQVRKTPVIVAPAGLCGATERGWLKLDCMQVSGSFKARGAFNAILAAPVPEAGLVAASGGNHGAAVACAAQKLGVTASVFVPATTPDIKLARLRDYGAAVHCVGDVYADAFRAAVEYRDRTGARMLHAYDEFDVVAGQGTVMLEFMEQVQAEEGTGLDTVLVAVGGGGLVGGTIAALRDTNVRVIAVETEGTATLASALRAGGPVSIDVRGVAADSLGARTIGALGFALASSCPVQSIVVSDGEVLETRRRLWEDLRVAAEAGGATALSALISGRYAPRPGERVGVIVCGGNTDPASLAR